MDAKAKPEMPANVDAEKALLGSVLVGGVDVLHSLEPPIEAGDFSREMYGSLWGVLAGLECPEDFVAVCDAVERAGLDMRVGDISELAIAVPSSTNANEYARIVREYANTRRLILIDQQNVREAYDTTLPTEDKAQRHIRRLESVITPDSDKALLEWDRSFEAFLDLQELRQKQRGTPKVILPWAALKFVRPLRPGTLAVAAAASGVGKTIFAECCADAWAQAGFQVAFFHYELSHEVMLDRRMARWSSEPMAVIESGEVTQRMVDAADKLREWPGKIHYIYCNSWPMTRVVAKARTMRRSGVANVVVVDYIQKAPLAEYIHGVNAAQMRAHDAELLKTLAERESVPVLTLSQFSKEGAKDGRKTRHGIRDTGEIDEKANLVITLDRELLNEPTSVGGRMWKAGDYSPMVTVRVDKQTMGPTGEVQLLMIPEQFALFDVSNRKEPGR